ncbi:MAG TPA: ankyrin repeat domain-containing protein [Allosphingosinicella sp.]
MASPIAAQAYSDSFTFLKAVRERDGAKVQTLISAPGSTAINAKGRSDGEGALHLLVRDRDLPWLNYLLSRGARPDIQNNQGDTPLTLAAQLGWVDGVQLLLARRASVDLPNGRGETPLILAVQKRDMALVRALLDKGANPKRTDSVAGYSAIDYARQDARAAAILKLLEAPKTPAKPVYGPTR